MANAKEYRGQPIIAQLSARMEPPSDDYADCECMLVLTDQHLYILEDNYDGDYTTHFEFVLREIDDIRISGEAKGLGKFRKIIVALLKAVGGSIIVSDGRNGASDSAWKRFEIHYHTADGIRKWLYFTEYDIRAQKFIKAFCRLMVKDGCGGI
ncbi:MAG: hypothetical protein K2H40_05500 [Lachnospiraceae bacterium]|nr:hypothetical protein [Lachnospiraceae bacterium]